MDGEHHFNEVVFDAAVLPENSLLGERGEGWRQVTAELAHERSGPERLLSTVPLLRAWADQLGADPVATRELGRLTARGGHCATCPWRWPRPRFEGDVVETVRRVAGIEPRQGGPGLEGVLADGALHTPAFTLRGGTQGPSPGPRRSPRPALRSGSGRLRAP